MRDNAWPRAALLVTLGAILAGVSCGVRSHASYLGEWRVGWFRAPNVAALAPTEAVIYIGTPARYDKHRAVFGKDTCDAPTYSARTLTPEAFASEYRVSAADLDLTGDTISLVTVTCASAWTNRGSVLILKSPGVMLTMWDGVFFELERLTQ